MLRRSVIVLVIASIVLPVYAAAAGRDLVIPIVGRAVGNGGREYRTTLHIASTGPAAAVELTFQELGGKTTPVRSTRNVLAGGAAIVDVDASILGADRASGTLRLRADAPVLAAARITMNESGAGTGVATTVVGVPAEWAIGTGESTILQGLTNLGGDYKLYIAETTGQPLHVDVTAIGTDAAVLASRRMFVDAGQSLSLDVGATLGLKPDAAGFVRVSGVNGSGKVVASGELIAEISRGSSSFSMQVPSGSRHRVSWGEWALYGAVLLVLVAAIIRRR